MSLVTQFGVLLACTLGVQAKSVQQDSQNNARGLSECDNTHPWGNEVSPSLYELDATLQITLTTPSGVVLDACDKMAAFNGTELRKVFSYYPGIDKWITSIPGKLDEEITFEFFDSSNNQLLHVNEPYNFAINNSPLALTASFHVRAHTLPPCVVRGSGLHPCVLVRKLWHA